MCIKGHIIFNLFFTLIIKISNILFLNNIEWYILILTSIISCILPDIDHKSSTIGRKIFFKKKNKYKKVFFGHRKFTHSLLFLFILNIISKIIYKSKLIYKKSIFYGFFIGYINHILLDIYSKNGIYFFWPLNKKIKINLFRIIILIIILYYIFY